MEEQLIWEKFYNIRIISLNTSWRVNESQLKRLPYIYHMFGKSGFKDRSYYQEKITIIEKEESLENFSKDIHRLEKFIVLKDIYDDEPKIKSHILQYLYNIDWIFTKDETMWIEGEKIAYQLLNPEYQLSPSEKIYICINCGIKAIDENVETIKSTECIFHGKIIESSNFVNTNKILICQDCGFNMDTHMTQADQSKCHRVPSHSFLMCKNPNT
jgi:rubrerythrin